VYFKPQYEEHYASAHQGFAPPLESEMRELEARISSSSLSLWWFGVPAILKAGSTAFFAYGEFRKGRWTSKESVAEACDGLDNDGGPATMYRQDDSILLSRSSSLHCTTAYFGS